MSRPPSSPRPADRPLDRQSRGSIFLGLAGGMFVASGALIGAHFLLTRSTSEAAAASAPPPAAARSEEPPAQVDATLTDQVAAALERPVQVVIGDQTLSMRWSDLGVQVDPSDLAFATRRAADAPDAVAALRTAGALPVVLDRERAVTAIMNLKARQDRAAIDARLDLEHRTVEPERAGFGIDVWGSLARVELAARAGADRVELVGVPLPARVTRAELGIEDISHVLGSFTTKFSVADRDRNFNLKLAASKINGYVLAPGAEFSFNDVVGERSEKQGYKIAHVITAGEMVDGLAGGTCQISTTLFGASFFAGLEIVKTSTHSRPSAYVSMGMDATVVWPNTDLKLKNAFDFPVVIHYRVASGEAFVEVLGKKRPYDQIAFEREILEETPYVTEERPDETIPLDFTRIDQPGFNGYRLNRFRKFYKGGKVVRTERWPITYKPVTEYLRRGTNPDPMVPLPEQKELHPLKTPKEGRGRVVQ